MNERYRKRTTLNECQEHFKHLMKPLRENYYGEQIIDEDDFNNQQQPPQQQKKDNQMSKQNAEQLLNSVLQDEKGVQDKVKKQKVIQGGRLEKDW